MIIEHTDLDGVFLVKPTIHKDDRGYFFESYRDDKFKNFGLSLKFCQENQTKSNKGTLRGLHYQLRYPQGKLVRVSLGEVYDVAVDVRLNSPTFGKYYGTITKTGGAILLVTGVLISTNYIQIISYYILTNFPILAKLG